MTNLFIEGLKARVAREKKIAAEVETGLSYIRDMLGIMPDKERANALVWTIRHIRAGNIGQDQLDQFLLGKKTGDNDREDNNPYPDENDENDNDQGDDQSPDEPTEHGKRRKKGKKAAEPKDTCDDQDEAASAVRALSAGDYERGVRATADAIALAAKRARGLELSRPNASDDAVIAAEIKAGLPMTATQVLYCGRVRRGEVADATLLPPKGSPARMILDAGRKARGLPPMEG